MAVYQVEKNGNAPRHANIGDYIVTGGGTYEVLDGAKYAGKSTQELNSMGVGFNPSSGLYSRRVTDSSNALYTPNSGSYGGVKENYSSKLDQLISVPAISYKNYDKAQRLAELHYENQLAGLEANYNKNLENLNRSYNSATTNLEQQRNTVNADYKANQDKLYSDAYLNNALATQMASKRGLTSSAQGMAMNIGVLAQASERASQLTDNRDKLINDINANLNRISMDYDISRDTLLKNFNAGKLSALSTSDLKFMQAALEVDDYNANLWNSMVQNKSKMDWQSSEAEKERAFAAQESAKNRALQLQLSRYGRGGVGKGSGGKSSNDFNLKKNQAALEIISAKLNQKYPDWQSKLTPDQLAEINYMLLDAEYGEKTAAEIDVYLTKMLDELYAEDTSESDSLVNKNWRIAGKMPWVRTSSESVVNPGSPLEKLVSLSKSSKKENKKIWNQFKNQ